MTSPRTHPAEATLCLEGDNAPRKLTIIHLLAERLADELDQPDSDVNLENARRFAYALLEELEEVKAGSGLP